jgi:hypothetical protein
VVLLDRRPPAKLTLFLDPIDHKRAKTALPSTWRSVNRDRSGGQRCREEPPVSILLNAPTGQGVLMFRTHLLSQAVFRLICRPHKDLEARIDGVTFYIGLGDQFDDDRRLVRALASQHSAQRNVPLRPAYRSDRKRQR